MKPGMELDDLIAEKVMGCKYEEHAGLGRKVWKYPPEFNTKWSDHTKYYSTDIAAAWEVVEKMKELKTSGVLFKLSRDFTGLWMVSFDFGTVSHAKTAPHAICLAALKSFGIEVKE